MRLAATAGISRYHPTCAHYERDSGNADQYRRDGVGRVSLDESGHAGLARLTGPPVQYEQRRTGQGCDRQQLAPTVVAGWWATSMRALRTEVMKSTSV